MSYARATDLFNSHILRVDYNDFALDGQMSDQLF